MATVVDRLGRALAEPGDVGRQELDLLHAFNRLEASARADHGNDTLDNGHDNLALILVGRHHWGCARL